MGFSTLIDIVGSTIIGGLLLMILLRMNSTSVQNNYMYAGEKVVQQNIVEIVRLLEYDFRKIGYCSDWKKIPDESLAIIKARTDTIFFLTDIVTTGNPYGDGVVDTLKYCLSNTSTLSSTPNPNDRMLYRIVNHAAVAGSNLGVTQFQLTYYDANGEKLGTVSNPMPSSAPFGIASIQIDIAVENPAAYGNDYSVDKRVIWRQIRMATRNFTLR